MSQLSSFRLSAWRAWWVGRIRHETCRQWNLSGYVLYLWQPLSVCLLAWELAQDLKILVGFQTCTDMTALEPYRKKGGAPMEAGLGPTSSPSGSGPSLDLKLTGMVWDVRLCLVPAGNPWWLRFAEVLDELRLGHR